MKLLILMNEFTPLSKVLNELHFNHKGKFYMLKFHLDSLPQNIGLSTNNGKIPTST